MSAFFTMKKTTRQAGFYKFLYCAVDKNGYQPAREI